MNETELDMKFILILELSEFEDFLKKNLKKKKKREKKQQKLNLCYKFVLMNAETQLTKK